MMNNIDKKALCSQLEYWLLKPFSFPRDAELPEVRNILSAIQSFQDADNSNAPILIEEIFELNKMKYEYVDRHHVRKGIKAMKGSVISRMLNKSIIPAATKAVETVKPVVNKAMNETIIPAADKTLRFFHKTFAKKKTEVVETDTNSKE